MRRVRIARLRVAPCGRLSGQVPGNAAGRRGRGRDGGRAPPRRIRRRRARCRSPTAARARSTRCSRRAADRGVSRASPDRSAIRSTRSGACCRRASRWSRWRARAGSRWCRGRNDPLRASTRGTGELIAAARREGFERVLVAVGGSATTDGGLAAVEALGWSLQGIEVTVACDVETAFLDAARDLRTAEGRVATRRSRCSTRRLTARWPISTGTRTGVDVTALTGGGAAGGLAGGLAAIGAQLVPGFDVVAEAVGLEAAFEGADLVVTGEGKLDASSLEGKVVGGVLAWAADLGVPRRRGDRRSGRPTTRAPRSPTAPASRCSRSPIACGRPARPTRAPRCSSKKPPSKPAETALNSRRRRHRDACGRSARGTRGTVAIGGRSRISTSSASTLPSRSARSSSSVGPSNCIRPARRSAVAMIASDCAASSSSGRLRCSRDAEVDLRDRVAPEALDDVDEQPELDAPTFDERQHLERVAPRRVLAAERLHDVGELREQQREQRAGDELGDAAAAGRRAFERARVARLHEHGVGVGEQRREQPRRRTRRGSCGGRRRASRGGRRGTRATTSTARCPCPSRARPRAARRPRRRPGRRPRGRPRRCRRSSRRR